MKKIIAFVLLIVMTFSLAACKEGLKFKKTQPTNNNSNPIVASSGSEDVDDVSDAYKNLSIWLIENGASYEGDYSYALGTTNNSHSNMAVAYDSNEDCVYIFSIDNTDSLEGYHIIYLDNYSFGFFKGDDSIIGIVAASRYTRDAGELHVLESECANLELDDYLTLAKESTNALLDGLREFLSENNLGITLADLGFAVY